MFFYNSWDFIFQKKNWGFDAGALVMLYSYSFCCGGCDFQISELVSKHMNPAIQQFHFLNMASFCLLFSHSQGLCP